MTASRLARFALIGLGLLVYALVFAEVFLRIMDPQPLVPRFVTGSADGIRANMPDVAFRQWTPEVDVIVRYNDQGMRDDRPAPPMARAPGECRVALVGDSYFVGFESNFPQSFASRLEADLAAQATPARVLNFAVSGFGTAEMLVAIKARVAKYQPDLIIMSWHASDPADNIRANLFHLDAGQLTPTGAAFLPGVSLSDRLMRIPGYRWLIENSHAYSAIRERSGEFLKSSIAQLRGSVTAGDAEVASLQDAAGPVRPGTFQPPLLLRAAVPAREPVVLQPDPQAQNPDAPVLRGRVNSPGSLALDRALIYASRDAAAALGANFLLFDVPTSSTRTLMVSPIERQLGDLPGVAVASPLDAFMAAARPDLKLYAERGHHHWTPEGNALAAGSAAAAIARNGWLAGCGTAARAALRGVRAVPPLQPSAALPVG